MKKITMGVLKFLLLILFGVLAGCSLPVGNDAPTQAQPAQSEPPVLTVYKAPT